MDSLEMSHKHCDSEQQILYGGKLNFVSVCIKGQGKQALAF